MFTGIVEALGTVAELQQHDASESGGNGVSLTISGARSILGDCHDGDSIAVDGVCLTVTEFAEDTFKVGIAPETLDRTNLGKLSKDQQVNLERAVAGHVRFGGHFVQGHVDTTAEIVSIVPDENSLRYTFKVKDPKMLLYIVEKGFIAVNGTSLTVTEVDDDKHTFGVMLIAYTQAKVSVALKKVGDTVNIEVDLMGKLVEKQVNAALSNNSSFLDKLIQKQLEKSL